MILLLAMCLLSPTALGYPEPGYDDPVCDNHEDMPQHRDYQRMFATIGEYESESVDDIVIKLMCRDHQIEECCSYGPNYGPGSPDRIIEVGTNKTFLQRFEPIMEKIEEVIEIETERYKENSHRKKECPYWVSLEETRAFHDHRGNYTFKIITFLSNIIFVRA